MQKVVKFLEQYVQWVALALGVAWILYVGYAYWANPPVVADVDGKKVSPGEVDETILDSNAVSTLDKALKNQLPYPKQVHDLLTDKKPQYVEAFKNRLSEEALDTLVKNTVTSPFPGAKPIVIQTGPEVTPEAAVASLPVLPPGTFVAATGKKGEQAIAQLSVVNRPEPNPAVAPVVPVGGAADQSKFFQNPNDPAAKPIPIVAEEVSWITVSGKLDMQKVADAFAKANVPPAGAFTTFLHVTLMRQEVAPDGKPIGKPEAVKELTNAMFNPDWSKAADPNAEPQSQADYVAWAMAHSPDIVQPAFYEVLRGDVWRTVTMPDPAAAATQAAAAAFDPAQVKPQDIPNLTPEQKKQYFDWKKEQDKAADEARRQQAQQRNTRTPAGGGTERGGRSGRGAGGFFAPPVQNDGERIRPGTGVRGMDGGRRRGGERSFTETMPGNNSALPEYARQTDAVPNGKFSPAQWVLQQPQATMEVWAHDETTLPGHWYKYQLVIALENPLFGTQAMAKNPADEKVLAITAATDWTAPILSPKKKAFFVTNGGVALGGVPKVQVDYFKWEDGTWTKEVKAVQPGDRVGETPWTVVDLRAVGNASNENKVLLVSDDGQMNTRFYKTDRQDPEYARLQSLVKTAPTLQPGQTPVSVGNN